MTVANRQRRRSGRTEKISISLDRADLAMVRERARRLHGGNVSAVIVEGLRRLRQEEEGRETLAAWLGDAGKATAEERASIRAEWQDDSAHRPRRRLA